MDYHQVVQKYDKMEITYNKKERGKPLFCTPAGVRTLDTLIKSQVLYQLSYGCIISELRVQRYGVFRKPPNILRTFLKKR